MTASLDGAARTWDAVVKPALPVVADLHAPVTRIEFVADGRRSAPPPVAARIGSPSRAALLSMSARQRRVAQES